MSVRGRWRFPTCVLRCALHFLVCALTSTAKADLTIGAAISLSAPVTEIVAAYERKCGEKIRCSFAGSNVIARQIKEGAPIDLFISADEQTMASLMESDSVDRSSVADIAGNQLVVVTPRKGDAPISSARDLHQYRRIAVADPQSVPAGRYAREWLVGEGVWEGIRPRIVPLQNVRSALIAVETSNVEAAIVYRTEAATSEKVRIVHAVPGASTGRIRYPAGVVSRSGKRNDAGKLLEFLLGEEAREILRKHGFTKP